MCPATSAPAASPYPWSRPSWVPLRSRGLLAMVASVALRAPDAARDARPTGRRTAPQWARLPRARRKDLVGAGSLLSVVTVSRPALRVFCQVPKQFEETEERICLQLRDLGEARLFALVISGLRRLHIPLRLAVGPQGEPRLLRLLLKLSYLPRQVLACSSAPRRSGCCLTASTTDLPPRPPTRAARRLMLCEFRELLDEGLPCFEGRSLQVLRRVFVVRPPLRVPAVEDVAHVAVDAQVRNIFRMDATADHVRQLPDSVDGKNLLPCFSCTSSDAPNRSWAQVSPDVRPTRVGSIAADHPASATVTFPSRTSPLGYPTARSAARSAPSTWPPRSPPVRLPPLAALPPRRRAPEAPRLLPTQRAGGADRSPAQEPCQQALICQQVMVDVVGANTMRQQWGSEIWFGQHARFESERS